MLQWRIGLFFGAASLAGAFSGLLAYGINFMSGTHKLLGWSWIFILVRPSIKIFSFISTPSCRKGLLLLLLDSWRFLVRTLEHLPTSSNRSLVLVDFPATAKFLTLEERSFIVWRKSTCFHMC
jgi:hypothetical protein